METHNHALFISFNKLLFSSILFSSVCPWSVGLLTHDYFAIFSAYEHVYMRSKVNSNRFEVSNRIEMSFRLHGNLYRFHCGNFPNNSKTLLHMYKSYLLINANLINGKQMLRYWLFLNNSSKAHAH